MENVPWSKRSIVTVLVVVGAVWLLIVLVAWPWSSSVRESKNSGAWPYPTMVPQTISSLPVTPRPANIRRPNENAWITATAQTVPLKRPNAIPLISPAERKAQDKANLKSYEKVRGSKKSLPSSPQVAPTPVPPVPVAPQHAATGIDSATYSTSATNFTNALKQNNEFTSWMNTLGSRSTQPSSDEWMKTLEILDNALTSAEQVSPEFLNLIHPELEDKWTTLYIPSMEGIYYYYATSVYFPEKINELNSSGIILIAMNLDEEWSDWYQSNINVIHSEINKPR